MNKEKLNNLKTKSKRCFTIVILLFLLDTGSKIGKDFLKTVKNVEEFVENYDESLDRIIMNYPIIDSNELKKAGTRIIENYSLVNPGELDDSFDRIISDYPIVKNADKNQYVIFYLQQAIKTINGDLNFSDSLKKIVNSYFNQETDFVFHYYISLKSFIFEQTTLNGITYNELNNETKSKCLSTLSQLAFILQQREEKKVL